MPTDSDGLSAIEILQGVATKNALTDPYSGNAIKHVETLWNQLEYHRSRTNTHRSELLMLSRVRVFDNRSRTTIIWGGRHGIAIYQQNWEQTFWQTVIYQTIICDNYYYFTPLLHVPQLPFEFKQATQIGQRAANWIRRRQEQGGWRGRNSERRCRLRGCLGESSEELYGEMSHLTS
jgi:hypothetical protein